MKKIIFSICWICWFCIAYLFYGNVVNIIVNPSPAPKLCSIHCFDDLNNDFALFFIGSLGVFYISCLSCLFFKSTLGKQESTKKFFLVTLYTILVHIPPVLILYRLFTTSADQQHGPFVALLYFVIALASFIFYAFHQLLNQ